MTDDEYEAYLAELAAEIRDELAEEMANTISVIGMPEVFEAMIQATESDGPAQILLRAAQHAYAAFFTE